jgi:hypothetical protein
MMEELNTALATLITQATQGVEAGVSFLQAELPEVVEQLLMWHFTVNLISFIGACVVTLAACIAMIPLIKCIKAVDSYWVFETAVATVIGYLLIVLITIKTYNLEWLQIWLAPKVWLLEYSATLIK